MVTLDYHYLLLEYSRAFLIAGATTETMIAFPVLDNYCRATAAMFPVRSRVVEGSLIFQPWDFLLLPR